MHRPGWVEALLDAGLQTPANYWTLYDHPDKYENSLKLPSRIFLGNVCHWRETPSTTNTFATRFKTLKEDIRLFRKYSTGVSVSCDHARFLALGRKKRRLLVSAIPSYATHMELAYLSPFWCEGL